MSQTSTTHTFATGLTWTDVPGDDCVALFIIPTPTIDDSGIAHICEHLVFRYSQYYPEPHNLFALTALTPCEINASSQNNETLFFVTAPDKASLKHLVRFIYAGLQCITYNEKDVELERDGVIFQELSFYEHQPHYQRMIKMWRDDARLHKYYHWGGYSDTINQVSLIDIIAYKKQFYSAENIHCLSTGLDASFWEDTTAMIPSIDEQVQFAQRKTVTAERYSLDDIYYPKSFTFAKSEVLVSSWWLAADLHAFCIAHEDIWQRRFSDLMIEPYLNQNKKFAIRITQSDWQEVGTYLHDFIREHWSYDMQAENLDHKFPPSIKKLLRCKESDEPQQLSFSRTMAPYQVLQTQPNSTRMGKLPGTRPITLPHYTKPATTANIVHDISCTTDIRHASCPKHIEALYHRAITMQHDFTERMYCETEQWIALLPISPDGLNTKLLSSVPWEPRISGDCYAMGYFVKENQCYLWAVSDKCISTRQAWIDTIFEHA